MSGGCYLVCKKRCGTLARNCCTSRDSWVRVASDRNSNDEDRTCSSPQSYGHSSRHSFEVHRQGGAVVAAHPFRWGQPFDEIIYEEQPELDGVELMTSNMDEYCRRRTAELVGLPGMRPLAGLGSSDAHREEALAACYTVFDGTVRDGRDLVEAIRGRRATPHDRLAEEANGAA